MSRRMLLIVLLCYCIFFVATPPFQLNDEPDHFQYVFWLARGVFPKVPKTSGMPFFDKTVNDTFQVMEVAGNDNRIPNFELIKNARKGKAYFHTLFANTPLTYQAHHPPLYHFLASGIFRITDGFTKSLIPIFYSVRLTSVFFYFFSVVVAWFIAYKLTKNKKTSDYLTAVYAINPVTLKMGVALNPDIAAVCMGLIVLLLFLSAGKKILQPRFVLFTIVILTIGAYLKFQNTVFFVYAFLMYCFHGVKQKQFTVYFVRGIFVFLASWTLFSPWLVYSWMTTHQLTPSALVYTFFCTPNNPTYPWYRIPFEALFEFRHGISHFAGFLGWGEPYPFKPFFTGYALCFALFTCVGVTSIIKKRSAQLIQYLFPHAGVILLFFYGVSLTYKINRYSCDIQGRYLLPALFPFILFIWIGITRITGREKQSTAYWMFLFAIWQFFFILFYVLIPRYYV